MASSSHVPPTLLPRYGNGSPASLNACRLWRNSLARKPPPPPPPRRNSDSTHVSGSWEEPCVAVQEPGICRAQSTPGLITSRYAERASCRRKEDEIWEELRNAAAASFLVGDEHLGQHKPETYNYTSLYVIICTCTHTIRTHARLRKCAIDWFPGAHLVQTCEWWISNSFHTVPSSVTP